jgi:hypothetical protein
MAKAMGSYHGDQTLNLIPNPYGQWHMMIFYKLSACFK